MQTVSLETQRYLQKIASRVSAYQKIRWRTLDILDEYDIEDPEVTANCIIVGFLWLASVREEVLTENEMLMHLGLEDTLSEDQEMILDPEIAEMSFDDAIEYCLENLEDGE